MIWNIFKTISYSQKLKYFMEGEKHWKCYIFLKNLKLFAQFDVPSYFDNSKIRISLYFDWYYWPNYWDVLFIFLLSNFLLSIISFLPFPIFLQKRHGVAARHSSFISHTYYCNYLGFFQKTYLQIQQIILLVDEYLWKLSCGVIWLQVTTHLLFRFFC